MEISIIVAVADNGVIGRDNDLPWRLSADLRRFKALTMGHHLLLGRKTFDSIGRPLPGREMIVVSRSHPELPEGVHLSASIEAAIERARAYDEDELFVAGGASIYAAVLPRCDRIYLTRVHAEVDGDVRLPDLDLSQWDEVRREELPADEDNEHATTFSVLERASSGIGSSPG
ncbi:MAG: dihydrofolate reductase [Acidobacteriota bacterium]|jgi:dihydrofolate reductase